jgi:hypothetical protein
MVSLTSRLQLYLWWLCIQRRCRRFCYQQMVVRHGLVLVTPQFFARDDGSHLLAGQTTECLTTASMGIQSGYCAIAAIILSICGWCVLSLLSASSFFINLHMLTVCLLIGWSRDAHRA